MGIALDTRELAWAAGLFDAEGTAGAYRRRTHFAPQLMLSQAGDELPDVLVRFRAAVGGQGLFVGPARGYLYYWYTHRFESIQAVAALLWTFLGRRKRMQLRRTLLLARGVGADGDVPSAPTARDGTHELAWAAGFFGGEGWVGGRDARPGIGGRWIRMSISQAADEGQGVPELLARFTSAIGAAGRIRGPRQPNNPWSKRPRFEWDTSELVGDRADPGGARAVARHKEESAGRARAQSLSLDPLAPRATRASARASLVAAPR